MTAGIILSNYFLPYLVNKLSPQIGFLFALTIKCVAYVFYLNASKSI